MGLKLKMLRDTGAHPLMEVVGWEALGKFCAHSWCEGSCGFPALVLQYQHPELEKAEMKAYGDMVACGPVFQRFRVAWIGAKIEATPEMGEADELMKMMWW